MPARLGDRRGGVKRGSLPLSSLRRVLGSRPPPSPLARSAAPGVDLPPPGAALPRPLPRPLETEAAGRYRSPMPAASPLDELNPARRAAATFGVPEHGSSSGATGVVAAG